MKRIRIPGLIDIVRSDDAAEIALFARDGRLDRGYGDRSILLNGWILRRVLKVLQVDGRLFPTVTAREVEDRAAAQEALWTRLNGLAAELRENTEGLADLAGFVRGEGPAERCGMLVQGVVGRLFAPGFRATEESWEAALVLDKAPRTMNPVLELWWALTHRVERAKRLLFAMVGGDLAGVHAVGIALHNIVSGVMY